MLLLLLSSAPATDASPFDVFLFVLCSFTLSELLFLGMSDIESDPLDYILPIILSLSGVIRRLLDESF